MPCFADEQAHPESLLEWWFIQGHYGSSVLHRHFMVSFFRFRSSRSDERHAFSALLTVLEKDSHRPMNLTLVEPAMIEFITRLGPKAKIAGLDRDLVDTLMETLSEAGPPIPIQISRKMPIWAATA